MYLSKISVKFIHGMIVWVMTMFAPQIQYSARNVVTRISQALDILHNEVCFYSLCVKNIITDYCKTTQYVLFRFPVPLSIWWRCYTSHLYVSCTPTHLWVVPPGLWGESKPKNASITKWNKIAYFALTAFFVFSFICSCIVKPREGSAEVQQIHELNRAYQVSNTEI